MQLVNVSPRFPTNDTPYLGVAKPRLAGEINQPHTACTVAASHFAHLLLGEFGVAVALAARGALGVQPHPVSRPARHSLGMTTRATPVAHSLPALPVPVGHVLGVRAQEQVRGVDTSGVVAAVTNGHAVGDRTMGQRVGNPMGLCVFPAQLEMGVAVTVMRAAARPAIVRAVGLVNLLPESLCHRAGLARTPGSGATLGAKSLGAGSAGKSRTAVLAGDSMRTRHADPPTQGWCVAAPGGVTSTAPASLCHNYSMGIGKMGQDRNSTLGACE